MLKKEKKRAADMVASSRYEGVKNDNMSLRRSTSQPLASEEEETSNYSSSHRGRGKESFDSTTTETREQPRASPDSRPSSAYNRKLQAMSAGRKEAFEIFRRDYVHNDTVERNKRDLKQRYADAKSLGEQVNSSRLKINRLKTQIEQHRVRRSMQGLMDGEEDEERMDPEETKLRQAIEEEKARYKESFTSLRSLKTEIEHLQHFLERAKVQMQKDFEIWWAEQAAVNASKPADDIRAAWKTPPLSPIRPTGENPRPPSASRRHRDLGGMETGGNSGKMASKLRAEALLAASGLSSTYSTTLNSADSGRGSAEVLHGREFAKRESSSSDGGINNYHTGSRDSSGGYSTSKSRSAQDLNPGSSIPLTGDSRADADIRAFIRARQNLLQQKGRR